MDQSTQAVHAFLLAMQPVRDALGDFIRKLNRRTEVKIVSTYEPQMYLSSDFGVSAELHNGAVIDFWIELSFEKTSWQVSYSVLRHDPDEDGSHSERKFPVEMVHSAPDLPKNLLVAIERLRQASETDDLFR